MISIGEIHPDSKKILRRDDSRRRRASATARTTGFRNKNRDHRVQKQTTRPRLHFRNQTQLHSGASVLTIIINKASKNTEKIRENIREG